jgi:hypothetical protein
MMIFVMLLALLQATKTVPLSGVQARSIGKASTAYVATICLLAVLRICTAFIGKSFRIASHFPSGLKAEFSGVTPDGINKLWVASAETGDTGPAPLKFGMVLLSY